MLFVHLIEKVLLDTTLKNVHILTFPPAPISIMVYVVYIMSAKFNFMKLLYMFWYTALLQNNSRN